VDATKDLIQEGVILRILLKIDQLVIDARQQVAGFDQEILQQIFHPLKVAHLHLLGATSVRAEAREGRVLPKPKSLIAFSLFGDLITED
jgi:hypothetical protein